MATCREIESTLAAFVDGDAAGLDRGVIEAHLAACPPCRARAAAERAAHEVVRARRQELRGCAPADLRRRCALHCASRPGGVWRRRSWVPMSVAASLLVAAGVFLLFAWGSSVETYAAQLAVDHVKCFQFPPDAGGAPDVTVLGRTWKDAHGWPLKIAASSEGEQLQLLGMRRCGSTRGRVAHILYKWRGQRLSLFVLNGTLGSPAELRDGGAPTSVTRFGENAIMWAGRGRTYAIVSKAPVSPELLHLAEYMRRTIE